MAAVAAVLLAGRGESSGGSAQPEPTSGREEAASPAPDGAQATEAAAPSSAGHAPVWLISGEVAGGEASLLDPLYVVERPPADLPERGEHRIEARDERGEALAAQPFQPELDVDGTGGEGTGGDQAGSFATLLAYEPDAVELAVVGPEEATLTSVSLEGARRRSR